MLYVGCQSNWKRQNNGRVRNRRYENEHNLWALTPLIMGTLIQAYPAPYGAHGQMLCGDLKLKRKVPIPEAVNEQGTLHRNKGQNSVYNKKYQVFWESTEELQKWKRRSVVELFIPEMDLWKKSLPGQGYLQGRSLGAWRRSAVRPHHHILGCRLYCVGGDAMIRTVLKDNHFGSKCQGLWGKTNNPFGLHLHILSISLPHSTADIPFSMSLGSYLVTPVFPPFFPCVFLHSGKNARCPPSYPLWVYSSGYLLKHLYKIVYLISYKYATKLVGVVLFFFDRYRTWKLLTVKSWKVVSSDQNFGLLIS